MFSKILESIGMGQKKYNCPTCHESFSTRLILDAHKTNSHPNVVHASWEAIKDRHG
jgi:hypothetical protein